ncbi:MAG TPA: hypothetical protein VFS21_05440 [Roseiflexaceae bacterium]|nr:hypothetical protein [Roseiflexaceae bacterium]
MPEADEGVVSLFPCASLSATLDFYRALGFAVSHEQDKPYLYAAVQRGGVELHFSNLRAYGAKNGFGAALVFVSDVALHHWAFADGLRAHYGAVPTAGTPRITRLRPGQTRFTVFDPTGNVLIYIDRREPAIDYGASDAGLSALEQVLDNAVFLRDTYSNDAAAAKVLDRALDQHRDAAPIDRARALAARAELAVALGDVERAQSARAELGAIALPEALRARFREELEAADDLERWRTQAGS